MTELFLFGSGFACVMLAVAAVFFCVGYVVDTRKSVDYLSERIDRWAEYEVDSRRRIETLEKKGDQ